jgi:hypothetical protein
MHISTHHALGAIGVALVLFGCSSAKDTDTPGSAGSASSLSGGAGSGGTKSTSGAGAGPAGGSAAGGSPSSSGAGGSTMGGSGGALSSGGAGGGGAGGGGAGAGSSSGGTSGNLGSGGSGGASTVCTRDMLHAAVQSLAAALTAKDSTKMTLDTGAQYLENLQASSFTQGIWQNAVTVAYQREWLDVDQCQSFTELVITQGHPYVIGARLKVTAGKVKEVSAIVADQGDWLFDATNYYNKDQAEDWTPIAEADRDTADVLQKAGTAYFDNWADKSVKVPLTSSCTRLEGSADGACSAGLPPTGTKTVGKEWLVDRELGSAVCLLKIGDKASPDFHVFRVLKGQIALIHTVAVCPC